MERLGIRGTTLEWFKSYLTNRTQKVDVNAKLSDEKSIDIGVLQGSTEYIRTYFIPVLYQWPACLLWHVFFADDTACLISDNNVDTLFEKANCELQKRQCWFKANKLAVNVKKTKYIVFRQKRRVINLNNHKLIYNDNDIGQTDNDKLTELDKISNTNQQTDEQTYKYLGILIDEFLTFDQHFTYLTGKLAQKDPNSPILCPSTPPFTVLRKHN